MPRGEISSGKFAKRHPLDWYVEEQWVTRQLIDAMGGFRLALANGDTIGDPACGMGNVPAAFGELAAFAGPGFDSRLILSDVVRRVDESNFEGVRFEFFSADFLEQVAAPRQCSVVCNPPYSYRKCDGIYDQLLISEAFAYHAIRLASLSGGRFVCLLVPAKWLASQSRYRLFTKHPPAAVLHLTQRPSMPPGDRIDEMGNRAFNGGMIDYCWIVWDVQRPTPIGETRAVWLPPLRTPVTPIPFLTNDGVSA